VTQEISKKSFILMVGRGVVFFINVVTPIFLVRFFSKLEYGEYRQVMLILSSFSAILPFGLTNSLFYFFPAYPKEKNVYLSRTIGLMFVFGVLFSLLFALFNRQIGDYLQNSQLHSFHIYLSAAIGMLTLSALIETVLVIDNKIMLSTQVMAGTQILRTLIIIFCGIIGGVTYIVYGLLFLYASKTIGSLVYFKFKYNISVSALKMRDSFEHLKYAIPFGMGVIFGSLSEVVDKYMISNFLGVDTFAVYAVGCYELPFIAIVFSSVADVILPNIVENKEKNNRGEVVKLWHYSIEVSMLMAIPLYISFFVFADQFIVTVFTSNYAAAVPVFRIAILTVLLEGTRYGMITRAYAKTGFMFIASLVSLLFMLPSCYFGIKHYGLAGAIVAVMLSRALLVASEIIYSKYLLSLRWSQLLPFRYMAKITFISIVSTTLSYLIITNLPQMNNWLSLFITFSIIFISYIYLASLCRCWNPQNMPFPEKVNSLLNRLLANTNVS
jgi:O-antigen/teichoic acid export membrane protein